MNESKRYVKNVILWQQVDNFLDQHLSYFEYTIIELIHFLTNAHIYAHKHVVYAVAEIRRIRGTELYRQQKTPSCTMALKSNFSLNQAWPQWPR